MAREDWQAMDGDSGAGPDSHTLPDLLALDRLIVNAYTRLTACNSVLSRWEPDIVQAQLWLAEAQQALSNACDLTGVMAQEYPV